MEFNALFSLNSIGPTGRVIQNYSVLRRKRSWPILWNHSSICLLNIGRGKSQKNSVRMVRRWDLTSVLQNDSRVLSPLTASMINTHLQVAAVVPHSWHLASVKVNVINTDLQVDAVVPRPQPHVVHTRHGSDMIDMSWNRWKVESLLDCVLT